MNGLWPYLLLSLPWLVGLVHDALSSSDDTPCQCLGTFYRQEERQPYRNQTKWRGMQTQLIEESLTQEALVQSLNAHG